MSDTCPVVKIKTPNGWAHLNEADFDPARHELWHDPLDHDGDGKRGGSLPKADADAVTDNYPTDEEMRAAIKAATGKAPHWKANRETIIAAFDELHTDQKIEG